jgi:hypothetical protein
MQHLLLLLLLALALAALPTFSKIGQQWPTVVGAC